MGTAAELTDWTALHAGAVRPRSPSSSSPCMCDTPSLSLTHSSSPLLQTHSPTPTLPPCHPASSVPACQTRTNLVPWPTHGSTRSCCSGVIWRLVVAAIGRLFRTGFDLIYLASLGPARLLAQGGPRPADRQLRHHRRGRPLPSQAHLCHTPIVPSRQRG